MSGKLSQLEIKQTYLENLFKDYVSVEELRNLTKPKLSREAIVNAIIRGRLDAKGTSPDGMGWYIIHLPSARRCWPERFE